MIRAGPIGKRASSYEDVHWDEMGRNMISHIYISFDVFVRSIQFGYLERGTLVLSEKYGQSEGYNLRVVRLNEDEYVTGLSGVVGDWGELRNLTFHTNLGKHGPIGCLDGNYLGDSKMEIDPAIRDRREFGGFFGSYNINRLLSLGMYANPIAMSNTVVKREII